MIGTWQGYALLGLGIIFFGRKLIIKTVKDALHIKKEVNEIITESNNETKKENVGSSN